MAAKYRICIDKDLEDIEVEGDSFWLDEASGHLKILRNKALIAFFPAGHWLYFMADAP